MALQDIIINKSIDKIRNGASLAIADTLLNKVPSSAARSLTRLINTGNTADIVEKLMDTKRQVTRLYFEYPDGRKRWDETNILIRSSVLKQIAAGKLDADDVCDRFVGFKIDHDYCTLPDGKLVRKWVENSFDAKIIQKDVGGSVWILRRDPSGLCLLFIVSKASGSSFALGMADGLHGVHGLYSVPHISGSKSLCCLDLISRKTWDNDSTIIHDAMEETFAFALKCM